MFAAAPLLVQGAAAAGFSSAPQLMKLAGDLLSSARADFWHKKDQKHLDNRQDSEIQRRVDDALEAGINPYDAIGAGSGAGSSTLAHSGSGGIDLSGLNLGSYLDYQVGKESVKQAQEATKQQKLATDMLSMQKRAAERQSTLDKLEFAYYLGADTNAFDPYAYEYSVPIDSDGNPDFSNSHFLKKLEAGYNQYLNEADMIRKTNDWFTTNQWLNVANTAFNGVGSFTGAAGNLTGAYRNYQGGKYFRAQRNFFEPEFTYPKHEMGFHP